MHPLRCSVHMYILWADLNVMDPLEKVGVSLGLGISAPSSYSAAFSSAFAGAPELPSSLLTAPTPSPPPFSFSHFSLISISSVWRALSGGTWPLKVGSRLLSTTLLCRICHNKHSRYMCACVCGVVSCVVSRLGCYVCMCVCGVVSCVVSRLGCYVCMCVCGVVLSSLCVRVRSCVCGGVLSSLCFCVRCAYVYVWCGVLVSSLLH